MHMSEDNGVKFQNNEPLYFRFRPCKVFFSNTPSSDSRKIFTVLTVSAIFLILWMKQLKRGLIRILPKAQWKTMAGLEPRPLPSAGSAFAS